MKRKKTVWFSAFTKVVPADYENWLEDLASQGWHAERIGQWSSIFLTLRKGEPRRYRYVYDMQAIPGKDYKATYEQFGWEFVGQMASALIWRKEYTGERPESFSDAESLEKRNRRVMYAASVSFFLFLLTAAILTVCFALKLGRLTQGDTLQFILGMALTYAFTIYMGSVLSKIYRNKRR